MITLLPRCASSAMAAWCAQGWPTPASVNAAVISAGTQSGQGTPSPARAAICSICMSLPDRAPRRRMRAAGPVSRPPGCLMPGSLSAAHGGPGRLRASSDRMLVAVVRATPYSLSLAMEQVSDFRRTAWVVNDEAVAVRLVGDRSHAHQPRLDPGQRVRTARQEQGSPAAMTQGSIVTVRLAE